MGRVLVVDDEPPIRAVLGRLLARRGHEFRDAGTLAEATARLRNWSPHVVILDVGLGPEDGLELLPVAGALAVPAAVIVCSGAMLGRPPVGAVAVVDKPFDFDVLLDLVDTLTANATGLT